MTHRSSRAAASRLDPVVTGLHADAAKATNNNTNSEQRVIQLLSASLFWISKQSTKTTILAKYKQVVLVCSSKRNLCSHSRHLQRPTSQQVAPPPLEQGAFICHAGQRAKYPDSLEHATRCQPGGSQIRLKYGGIPSQTTPTPKCKAALAH